MAINSSGTIKMSDINTELGRTSTTSNTSLKDCSNGTNGTINTANASSDRPDGSAPHAMSEWYSYNHSATSLTSFTAFYGETQNDACNSSEAQTFYHDGTGTTPTNGDEVYTNSSGTSEATDGYYKTTVSGGVVVNDGQAGLAFVCSGGEGRSERRLKHNIEFIGDSPMGIPMYYFNYKNKLHGKGRFVGTMVDDLQRLGLDNVLIHTDDGIFVDYSKIDVPFHNVTN